MMEENRKSTLTDDNLIDSNGAYASIVSLKSDVICECSLGPVPDYPKFLGASAFIMTVPTVLEEVKRIVGCPMRRKEDITAVIDVFLDHATYNKFRAYLAKSGLDESTALVNVLERGMANYWLQTFKELKNDYPRIENLLNDYRRYNETLKALELENERLQKILQNEVQHRKTQSPTENMRVKT